MIDNDLNNVYTYSYEYKLYTAIPCLNIGDILVDKHF